MIALVLLFVLRWGPRLRFASAALAVALAEAATPSACHASLPLGALVHTSGCDSVRCPDGAVVAEHRAPLQARFVGQMAFAITDGTVTVMTDFPYQIGYADAPAYSPTELRGGLPSTLALITHRHLDHWEPALFAKTGWKLAGPQDVTSGLPADRVVGLAGPTAFGPVQIEPLETPHARIGHYSYIVTWHGRRLYFSGDTTDARSVILARNLDVAFVSPWLSRTVMGVRARIDAKRIVIYHHEAGQEIPGCAAGCVVPRQGDTIAIP